MSLLLSPWSSLVGTLVCLCLIVRLDWNERLNKALRAMGRTAEKPLFVASLDRLGPFAETGGDLVGTDRWGDGTRLSFCFLTSKQPFEEAKQ